MDIQGYELHALRGASRVLADNPDTNLLLEFWPYGLRQAGARLDRVDRGSGGQNMSVNQVTTQGLIHFPTESITENPDWYVNLFAASK